MSTIGTFKKLEDGTYSGALSTLIARVGVTIKPVKKTGDKAPDYRIFSGEVELGAAWSTTRKDKKPYISVKLDDPIFPAPVMCRLVQDGTVFSLIWTR